MSLNTFGDVNYLAVLTATGAYFLIGGLWYSPVVFGKAWMEASGIRPEGGPSPVLYLFTLATEFVAALGLAFLARAAAVDTVGEGLLLGAVAGVGFSLTALWVTQAYESRPLALKLINGGYHVVALLVVGIIVAIWE